MTKSRFGRSQAEAPSDVEREEGVADPGEEAAAAAPDGPTAKDEGGAGAPGGREPEPREDAEADALAAHIDELNDRHLRLAAEFTNYRRRSEQERLETWSRAQADLVAKLLDVLDDLQRVAELDLTNTTVESITEGVDLVERKFVRMLRDAGVEIIDPKGQAFDPELMEAIMREPTDSPEADDSVAQVFQKGYALKGILVRPARVSVHKHG
jgi:molecular chaperone GrpE